MAVVDANTISIDSGIGVSYQLTFSSDGQSFSGVWQYFDMSGTITGTKVGDQQWPYADKYDVDTNSIPKFVETDFIPLPTITRISKFRSGAGHDYSDDFESCRSMKHYFVPKDDIDWTTITISSPVTGTVSGIWQEWAGSQVWIVSTEQPAFEFRIFHVNPTVTLNIGDSSVEGQQIGTHASTETVSDIAVSVSTPKGKKLVSYFDVMTDLLFVSYQSRGLTTRDDVIISQAERDADPLTCNGEEFENSGNLENWVTLTD